MNCSCLVSSVQASRMGLLPYRGAPGTGEGYERTAEFFQQIKRGNGLKGRQALSSGQRPEYMQDDERALQGQKQYSRGG